MYKLGSIVSWDSSSELYKYQKKLLKKHPDYLVLVSQNATFTWNVVPCWIVDPGYTICLFAAPRNLYIDAKKIVTVNVDDIKLCEDYTLIDVDDALRRIIEKNQELREKKHLAKVERIANKKEARKKQLNEDGTKNKNIGNIRKKSKKHMVKSTKQRS